MSTPDSLLFDVSSQEDDSTGKKKARSKKRSKVAAATPQPCTRVEYREPAGYLAKVDGHYACDTCGSTTLDLSEIRRIDGKTVWMVTCGWWCGHSWPVDPIAGLLDAEDKRQMASQNVFRVKGGRFDGQTFDEIQQSGNRWYIESLVGKSRRTFLANAAAEWLSKNN